MPSPKRARANKRVERDERVERRDHLVAMRAELVGELAQNAFDFLDLVRLELAHPIAELHGRRRLDEQRRARRRRVVDDAAGDGLAAAPNGDDVAAVAHRHGARRRRDGAARGAPSRARECESARPARCAARGECGAARPTRRPSPCRRRGSVRSIAIFECLRCNEHDRGAARAPRARSPGRLESRSAAGVRRDERSSVAAGE